MKRPFPMTILALFGCQSATSPPTPAAPATTAAPAPPVRLAVEANELRLAYGAEPEAAAAKYTGKPVKVKCPGHSNIAHDEKKNYYVRGNLFEGDRRMVAIVFRLNPESAKRVENTAMTSPQWTFWGEVRGLDWDPGSPGEKAVIVDRCDIFQDK